MDKKVLILSIEGLARAKGRRQQDQGGGGVQESRAGIQDPYACRITSDAKLETILNDLESNTKGFDLFS